MRNLNELKVILYSFFILFNQLYLFSQDKSVNDEIFAIAEVFKVNKKHMALLLHKQKSS